MLPVPPSRYRRTSPIRAMVSQRCRRVCPISPSAGIRIVIGSSRSFCSARCPIPPSNADLPARTPPESATSPHARRDVTPLTSPCGHRRVDTGKVPESWRSLRKGLPIHDAAGAVMSWMAEKRTSRRMRRVMPDDLTMATSHRMENLNTGAAPSGRDVIAEAGYGRQRGLIRRRPPPSRWCPGVQSDNDWVGRYGLSSWEFLYVDLDPLHK